MAAAVGGATRCHILQGGVRERLRDWRPSARVDLHIHHGACVEGLEVDAIGAPQGASWARKAASQSGAASSLKRREGNGASSGSRASTREGSPRRVEATKCTGRASQSSTSPRLIPACGALDPARPIPTPSGGSGARTHDRAARPERDRSRRGARRGCPGATRPELKRRAGGLDGGMLGRLVGHILADPDMASAVQRDHRRAALPARVDREGGKCSRVSSIWSGRAASCCHASRPRRGTASPRR